MSSFQIKKILGAILLAVLTTAAITMVRNTLYDRGGEDAGPAPAPVHAATAPEEAKPEAAKPAPAEPAIEPVGPLLAAASDEKGRKAFRKCITCHSAAEGQKHKIGPNLWNIANTPIGSRAGYKYSGAMRGKGGKWTYESLNAFLTSPKTFIPGTKMGFAGVKKIGQRADLIRYLRSLSEFPTPLP